MTSKSDYHQQQKLANAKDLFQYLEYLPKSALLKLYADETYGFYACRAVLQSALPELARQYVLRLAVCGGSFSRKDMALWHSSFGARDAVHALRRMEALSVVEPVEEKEKEKEKEAKEDEIRLTSEFHKGILKSISNLSPAPWEPLTPKRQELIIQQQTANMPENKANAMLLMMKHKKIKSPPTLEELEMYTQRRWESVLHYLVGSDSTQVEEPPEGVKNFLESTGLMQDDPDYVNNNNDKSEGANGGGTSSSMKSSSSSGKDKTPLIITSKGYEFMLQETHVQVWQFMLQLFLSFSKYEQASELRHEALLFLIALSYCKVGEGYLTKDLIKSHQEFLKFFKQLGLLYTCKIGLNVTAFYPTRVSISLVAGASHTSSSSSNSNSKQGGGADGGGDTGGMDDSNLVGPSASSTRVLESALASPQPSTSHIAIIVQTNFQLCAYTTSPLHVSMLGLFCDVINYRRLPNIIMYKITRDSVKDAFRLGITAPQILRFLKMHAHPRLRTGDQPLIPTNIEDQIWLWDHELRRVILEEVYVHQCTGQDEFAAVQQFAKDKYAYAWGSETDNRIMIRYERAEYILAYVRHWKAKKVQRMHRAAQESGSKRHSSYG